MTADDLFPSIPEHWVCIHCGSDMVPDPGGSKPGEYAYKKTCGCPDGMKNAFDLYRTGQVKKAFRLPYERRMGTINS